MAKISTYPIISIPTIDDLLIGTDVNDLNNTKNFTIGDIGNLIGQDYVPYVGATGNVNLGSFNITGGGFIVGGGTASQFLKADGSLDSTLYTPQTRTLTINGTTYNLSANRSWDLNTIDSLTTTGTSGAATYIGKVLNIPVYQEQGSYITQLSGEATGSGPGNASVTLSNSAVISKVLTGLNVTGGTVVSTDTILQAFGKVQNQINGLTTGVTYQGVWNAATNVPFLQSSVGTQGYYYVVDVAGTTNLNGITDWQVGDWAIYNGTAWQKVDNTDAVVSVNGYVGAVVLTASDVGAVPTTRTLTINGVGYNLSADRAWTVGDVRTDGSYANPSWITSLGWSKITGTPTTLAGYGITDGALNTTTLTINGTTFDLTANRTWNVGTVTSVGTSGPLTGGTITGSGTIGITQAGASSDGYLSSTDWNTFNSKQGAISVNAPLTFVSGVIGITQSGASSDGYLSSTDWNTFNSKVSGSGTANTLPMWGSSSSLINSPLSYAADAFNFGYNSATGGTVNFTNIGLSAYTYSIQMNNFGSPRSTIHSYTDGLIIQSIGGTQVSRMFANGNLILGTGTVDNGYKLEVTGNLYLSSIVNAIVDTDRFIVSDGGLIKYRTGAQVLSDIGAQGSLTLTTTGSSGPATLIGDTLNIPNYSSSLTGYVPYTGATQNVNLGEYGLSGGYFLLDTTPTGTPTSQGTIYWDDSRSTAALIMNGTIQHIGQDTYFYVKNSTGSSIPKGTAVRFAGTDGASGHLLIAPFLADGTYPSSYFMGVTSETIANGAFGQVSNFGELSGINTSAYTAGALLYASTTVAGGFQTTPPVAPNNIVLVAAAVNSKNNGDIVIRPLIGSNINNDEGVKIVSPVTGQLLQLQSNGLWENKTLAQVLGGTSSQFVKGDGSLDSNTYLTTSAAASTYVPYTGATGAVDLGTNAFAASQISINGAAPTSGSFLGFKHATTVNTGTNGYTSMYTFGTNIIGFKSINGANNIDFSFDMSAITPNVPGGRVYTLPNASGTIALVGGSGVGTVTSVAALTLGTSGTDLSSTVANSTTTPVITLNVPTASATNRGALSSSDWTMFNNKQSQLNGTGFVKASGTSITYDNSTYVTINTNESISGFKTFTNSIALSNSISNGFNFEIGSTGSFTSLKAKTSGGSNIVTLPSSNGTIALTSDLSGYIQGSGTTNYLPKFTGSTTIGDSLLVDNGVSLFYGANIITLGNSNTSEKYLELSSSTGAFYFGGTSAEHYIFGSGSKPISFYTNGTLKATLTSGGNLLVGTTTDNGARLQVSGTGTLTNLLVGTSATQNGRATIATSSDEYLDIVNTTEVNTKATGIRFGNYSTTDGFKKAGIFYQSVGDGASRGDLIIALNTAFNANNVTPANAVMTFKGTSGNVGIGTSSPSQKLVVQESGDAFIQIRNNTVGQNFFIGALNGETRLNNDNSTPITMWVNGSERMRITSGGNLLVGTTSDNGARLQVSGSGAAVSILNASDIWYNVTRGSSFTNIGVDSTGSFYNTNTNHRFLTNSGSTTAVTITSSGNVGIGTTNPGQNLHVSSTGVSRLLIENTANQSTGAGLQMLVISGASTVGNGTIRTDNADNMQFFNIGGERMRITSSGNVGIGTSSPLSGVSGGGLQVTNSTAAYVRVNATGFTGIDLIQGSDGTGYLYLRDNNDIRFGTSNTERMRITSNGKVLIGTTSNDGAMLQVAGTGGSFGDTVQFYNTSTNGAFKNTVNIGDDRLATWGLILGKSGINTPNSGYHAPNGAHIVNVQNGPIRFGTNNTERMEITSGGNVLVGTTTDAGSRLQVSGGATFSGFVEASTSSSSIYDFGIRNTGTGNTRLRIGNATSSARLTITLGAAANEFARIGPEGPFPLHLQTNGADRLSIDGSTGAATFSGDVTISRTSPTFRLTRGNTSSSSLVVYNTNGTDNWLVGTGVTGTNTDYRIYNNSLGADAIYINNSNNNVGIGTTTPTPFLNANARTLAIDSSGTNPAELAITGQNANVYLGNGGLAAYLYSTGSYPLIFGTNGAERMRITAGGEVLIGNTDNGAYNLQCNGTGVWGAGAYVNGSDRNIKDNIATIEKGLEYIKKMNPVKFRYKPNYTRDHSMQTGFIAQELQEVFASEDYLSGLVQQGVHLSVAYQNLLPVLVKAIQELKQEIDTLKN